MNNSIDNNALSMNAMSEIPTPRADAKSITGVRKKSGRIQGYQLSDGTMLDKSQALQLAREGGISGVGISKRSGSEYLKSLPDGHEGNNLSDLPVVN